MGLRTIIVGSSCSGKTTLGSKLSRALGLPHRELDELFWKENWTESSDEEFFAKLAEVVAQDSWVIDGNYGRSRQVSWPRATHVIWLDLPLPLVLSRLVQRSLRRSLSRQLLWDRCREDLWNSLLAPDSLLMWILKNYRGLRKRYESAITDNQYQHIKFIRLRSKAEVDDFLNEAPLRLHCHPDRG